MDDWCFYCPEDDCCGCEYQQPYIWDDLDYPPVVGVVSAERQQEITRNVRGTYQRLCRDKESRESTA